MKISASIAQALKKPGYQHIVTAFVALIVVTSVSYFGTHMREGSKAATTTPGSIYMLPETGSYAQGSTVSVVIRENSGVDPVNSVQASMSYNSSQLQYLSITEGTAFPTVAATSTSTPGVIRIGRAASNPVTGDTAVVTVNFRVLAASGTTSLTFDPAFSFLVRSSDNANILTATSGATFTLKLPAPTIGSVTPGSGTTAGGTVVTITGTNFVSGATVKFQNALATNVVVNSATSITATTPSISGVSGSVAVGVTNPDGQIATKAGGYVYIAPAPAVSSITPASGLTTGGTSVTLTGANFMNGSTVSFDGIPATNVVYVSSTTLTAVTPAGSAGTAAISVMNPDQQVSARVFIFTYTAPLPTISSVSPTFGLTTGGTAITITGTNFVGVTGVTLGGTAATNVVTNSSTTITAVTPAKGAGVVDVKVISSAGTVTRTSGFTYRAPAPVISTITPTVGTANGGTRVSISGSNLVAGATVSFGGVLATEVNYAIPMCLPAEPTCNSSVVISARAPAGTPGPVSIKVVNPDGQSATLANGFRYLALGDANNDGRVNAIDLSILISHDSQSYAATDFDGDGTVGAADMAILLARWTW